MKNLIHKYIGIWAIPKYKKLVQNIKFRYDKLVCWKYGIQNDNPSYMRNKYPEKQRKSAILLKNEGGIQFQDLKEEINKNKECCNGNCKCKEQKGEA